MANPVYKKGDLWYHCDESWSHEYGPFYSYAEAFEAYWRYAERL